MTETDREICRLRCSFTLQDQYVNPKAHAVMLWRANKAGRQKIRSRSKSVEEWAKKDPNARRYVKLSDEHLELFNKKDQKLQAKYGGPPFPEHWDLIESIERREGRAKQLEVFVPELSELEQEEISHLICAELERIIFGEARPETASDVEDVRRRISEAIDGAQQEKQRREEEARRRDEEHRQSGNQGVPAPDERNVLSDDLGQQPARPSFELPDELILVEVT